MSYKRRLRGWLSYAFASEVFVVVSLTLFLPICLEQFARDNGYLEPERTESCSSKVPSAEQSEERCVVKLGGVWIDTASFSLYVYSISVALQALTVISMGGVADRSSHRKSVLLIFGLTGAFAALLFLTLPSSSPVWPLAALLAMLANVGFGASTVAMNSYLPSLAAASPEAVAARKELVRVEALVAEIPEDVERHAFEHADHDHIHNADEAEDDPLLGHEGDLLALPDAQATYDKALSRATARISSLGIASGYGAGILLLIVSLVPVTLLKGSTFALRLAIGLSGAWWAIFSIPAALWLPGGKAAATRGAGAEAGNGYASGSASVDGRVDGKREKWSIGSEIKGAWRRLGVMLRWREIKRLRNTFHYLAAWFLLSDGFTTITSTAILFAKTSLHMPPSSLVLIGALTPSAGILGSLAVPYIQRRLHASSLHMMIGLVVMVSAIPAYGCLGFLPVFRDGGVGGLRSQGEMFVLAVWFGSAYGSFQSYARAIYAEMLPPGEEARWYGLFSITDKSSSFLGPLVVGLISDATGNIRYAFFFLVVMVWAAVPILLSVDVERGRRDARVCAFRMII
ncbi:MFS general substrate transporter [Coniophora puteana RWD-64-598 SS2]|uniref:Autophagy-related protein n=1 Tax=Coniophora puteana (strain RWD-64-598) TaxID=741705 RepID=R7SDK2_CONPW|nr:MFS general substrate transporter [Coniophora puteana RWD-64-598 SS2]EIW74238.1 MFS general substrate transporter [Coniophora puteana RWD-64-598 SS2]